MKMLWFNIKKYVWIPLLVLLAVLAAFLLRGSGSGRLNKLVQSAQTAHRAEVDAIESAHRAEEAAKKKAYERYLEVMTQLEGQYYNDKNLLNKRKKAAIRALAAEYVDDPKGLARKIAERFNMYYMPPEEVSP